MRRTAASEEGNDYLDRDGKELAVYPCWNITSSGSSNSCADNFITDDFKHSLKTGTKYPAVLSESVSKNDAQPHEGQACVKPGSGLDFCICFFASLPVSPNVVED